MISISKADSQCAYALKLENVSAEVNTTGAPFDGLVRMAIQDPQNGVISYDNNTYPIRGVIVSTSLNTSDGRKVEVTFCLSDTCPLSGVKLPHFNAAELRSAKANNSSNAPEATENQLVLDASTLVGALLDLTSREGVVYAVSNKNEITSFADCGDDMRFNRPGTLVIPAACRRAFSFPTPQK